MTKQDDGLFLLEVLIDKITFVKTPCMNDNNFRTCVKIQCLSVEPLEICDDDPSVTSSKSPGTFVKNFNAGKSCLFSLKEAEITKAMSSFPIKVNVYKSLPCSCLPSTVVMGEATIDMTKEFVEARKRFLADPNVVTYQALKDSFHLMGPDGTESGEIVMFLRISCFGKLITTQFQGNCGPPQLGSGGTVGAIERTCNPPRSYQSSMDPCVCGAAHASSSAPRSPGPPCASCGASTKQTGGPCPVARDPYNSMPCEEPEDECYCSGPKPKRKQAMACRNTDQYCLHLPKDCCPPGEKVIFRMPNDLCGIGHRQRTLFNLSSDGVGDVMRDDPNQPPDPDQGPEGGPGSQFIRLRVGKTVEMPGHKSKLEYNFITPVMTQKKKVPVRETRTAQCICRCPACVDPQTNKQE